jgi:hypothetical protein
VAAAAAVARNSGARAIAAASFPHFENLNSGARGSRIYSRVAAHHNSRSGTRSGARSCARRALKTNKKIGLL